MGLTTSPEAVTRVGTAGVGGEKRGRDREGTAQKDAESGRDVEGLRSDCTGGGAGGGTYTGRGSGRGTVVVGISMAGAVSSCCRTQKTKHPTQPKIRKNP